MLVPTEFCKRMLRLISTSCLMWVIFLAKAVDFIGTAPVKFCYYVHDDKGGLMPEDINGSLCTHIVYGFADIVNHTVYPRGTVSLAFSILLLATFHVQS